MHTTEKSRSGKMIVCVTCGEANRPIRKALVSLYATTESEVKQKNQKREKSVEEPAHWAMTGKDGCVIFDNVDPGTYSVYSQAFDTLKVENVNVQAGCAADVCLHDDQFNISITPKIAEDECGQILKECHRGVVGKTMYLVAEPTNIKNDYLSEYRWSTSKKSALVSMDAQNREMQITFLEPGIHNVKTSVHAKAPNMFPLGSALLNIASHVDGDIVSGAEVDLENNVLVDDAQTQAIAGNIGVTLRRSQSQPTDSQALWVAIRNRNKATSFTGGKYKEFIDRVLCKRDIAALNIGLGRKLDRELDELSDNVHGTAAYDLLKTATEVFLLLECGVAIKDRNVNDKRSDPLLFKHSEEAPRLGQNLSLAEIQAKLTDYLGQGRLPYINRIIEAAFPSHQVGGLHCEGVLTSRINGPCLIELIWSYWHEEGMLVQSINAISRRFQNVRSTGERNPLAHLEIDPLRPLNNILWGYIEDEHSRLSVKRRAYEYQHHYGLNLYGKVTSDMRPADNRSKFLEAFHNLLHLCGVFFKEDNDTTIIADGFPLLNALKEVHLILAQGAHNQFGDLPWTSRVEMLIQQWIMARPEIRDFLQSRAMVPYKEAWMPQVDTMKTLQGWSDVTVSHFHDLGEFGEQLLLSIRYHDWIDINNEDEAKNWGRYFRPEIQGYLHAYRAVTGVDLTNPDTVDYTLPSVHLRQRLASQLRAR
jgi:hypothetical protein